MTEAPNQKAVQLTPDALLASIDRSVKLLEKLNFLESYAVFMGRSQIVEAELKGLLQREFGFEEERLERCTLGAAVWELERKALHPQFVAILKELNAYRNDMAHHLLAIHAFGTSLVGSGFSRMSWKVLNLGQFKVAEVICVYDFLSANGYLFTEKEVLNKAAVALPTKS